MNVTMLNYKVVLPEKLWAKFLILVDLCNKRPGTKIVFEQGNVKLTSKFED